LNSSGEEKSRNGLFSERALTLKGRKMSFYDCGASTNVSIQKH